MTRKEKLLVEIYNLRNQIAEIKGNTIVNIEEFSQTRKFRDEAAEWKEFELKLRIEELKKSLEKSKAEAAQQAAADAFYATEQGQAFKREYEEKHILLGNEYDGAESATFELIESHLQAMLGKQWRANRLSTSYMELTVVDADNKPIFGQSVSIYYEKKCWLGGERFQINVGTCGSHDLLPEDPATQWPISTSASVSSTQTRSYSKQSRMHFSTMQNESQIFRKRCVSWTN